MSHPIGIGEQGCSDTNSISSVFCPNRNQSLSHWCDSKWEYNGNEKATGWFCPYVRRDCRDFVACEGWVDDPIATFKRQGNQCPACVAALAAGK